MEMGICARIRVVFMLAPLASAVVTPVTSCRQGSLRHAVTDRSSLSVVRMLRNVDSCEALIFTLDSALEAGEFRPGVARLFREAQEEGTLLAVLEPADRPIRAREAELLATATCWKLRSSDPSVVELTELRRALNVESPGGFGGSDGFGQAPGAAFGRSPNAAWCVVLVTNLREAEAALGAGMRTIGLPRVEGDWVDEQLEGVADGIVDALGEGDDALALRLCDLSTPGAFWLNPSLPRDAVGNRVDPETGETYANSLSVDDADEEQLHQT